MATIGTGAALAGAIAGFWNIWASFQTCGGGGGNSSCLAQHATPQGAGGTVLLALAVLMVVGSLATFLAPPESFYLLAAFGIGIDVIEVLNYKAIFTGWFYGTLILATLSVALSVAAALRRTSVSEQAHPMNLPVFG